jgi:hypothetical protein
MDIHPKNAMDGIHPENAMGGYPSRKFYGWKSITKMLWMEIHPKAKYAMDGYLSQKCFGYIHPLPD